MLYVAFLSLHLNIREVIYSQQQRAHHYPWIKKQIMKLSINIKYDSKKPKKE
jgi:hypothetical protein